MNLYSFLFLGFSILLLIGAVILAWLLYLEIKIWFVYYKKNESSNKDTLHEVLRVCSLTQEISETNNIKLSNLLEKKEEKIVPLIPKVEIDKGTNGKRRPRKKK